MVQPAEKIIYNSNSTEIFKNILPHDEIELNLNRYEHPFRLSLNDSINNEGNFSKMPDFDIVSLLEIRKQKRLSHGKCKNGNFNSKHKTDLALSELSKILKIWTSSNAYEIVLAFLDEEANKFYDRKDYLSQLMRLWYLSHKRPAKAQASLRIRAVTPEPSLFAQMKYGSRQKARPKIRHLAPLYGCACVFEE